MLIGGSAVANSAVREKPKKPRPDFPLFPHAAGYWAKKIRGRTIYFGAWADPDAALAKYLDQCDDLHAGRTPRASRDGLTVLDLVNNFLTAKEQQRDAGDIRPRSFDDYFATCEFLVKSFGKARLVDDLAADDFQAIRAKLAKLYGPHRLGMLVQRIRTVFKYGYEAGLIDKPIRYGPTFKKPAARLMRAHRQKNGLRMFEASELRTIIDAADMPMKAMVLLAANCGFGNSDCGRLPLSALNLKTGWVNYPRPKTAVERRCPLWPETVEAVREAIEGRPKAKQREHDGLAFVTKYGTAWAKETTDNPVSQEFRKLLDTLELYRPGLGFYAIRHGFETVAGEARDQVAVNHIMGHVDVSMSGQYRERIGDDRLVAVVNHVRGWLFGEGE
jgi:integrase